MPDIESEEQAQDFTPRQQRQRAAVILLVLGVLTFCAVQFAIAATAFTSWWLKVPNLLIATLFTCAVVAWSFSLLRRKWTTGRFLASRAETRAKIAEIQNRQRAGNPFWQWAIHLVIPAIVCAVFIGVAVVVVRFASCFCGDGLFLRQRIVLYAAGAALLFLGGYGLFHIIRRRVKTGSFRPSPEDLSKTRAKCAATKSLRQRILAAGMWCSIAAIWTGLAFRHPHNDPGGFSPWFLPVIAWFAAILYTWQVFRPSMPVCALSEEPDESQTPPDVPSQS